MVVGPRVGDGAPVGGAEREDVDGGDGGVREDPELVGKAAGAERVGGAGGGRRDGVHLGLEVPWRREPRDVGAAGEPHVACGQGGAADDESRSRSAKKGLCLTASPHAVRIAWNNQVPALMRFHRGAGQHLRIADRGQGTREARTRRSSPANRSPGCRRPRLSSGFLAAGHFPPIDGKSLSSGCRRRGPRGSGRSARGAARGRLPLLRRWRTCLT